MQITQDGHLAEDDGTPVNFEFSPNFTIGLQPKYLIMHYTAGSTAEGAIQWLKNPQEKNPDKRVSAHLVISRTGQITQLVPVDHIAWHAGFSYWEDFVSMNRYSIGIELDNDGALKRDPSGTWISDGGQSYPENELLIATHWKNFSDNAWKTYPDVQIQAALRAARAIVDHYQLVDILGHEDVHIAKVDPGPAFPMPWFRQQLFGREQPLFRRFVAARPLRIYKDLDGMPPRLPPRAAVSPLSSGMPVKVLKSVNIVKLNTIEKATTVVKKREESKKKLHKQIVKQEDNWSLVLLTNPINGVANIQGWVKSSAIKDNQTNEQVEIYKNVGVTPEPEPPLHPVQVIPQGTSLRILDAQGNMAMVGTLVALPRFKYLQGWIYLTDLTEVKEA